MDKWMEGQVYMGRIVGGRGKESRASDNWRSIREADSMMMDLRHIGGILVTYWWHISDILVEYGGLLVTYWWHISGILVTYWWNISDTLVP